MTILDQLRCRIYKINESLDNVEEQLTELGLLEGNNGYAHLSTQLKTLRHTIRDVAKEKLYQDLFPDKEKK